MKPKEDNLVYKNEKKGELPNDLLELLKLNIVKEETIKSYKASIAKMERDILKEKNSLRNTNLESDLENIVFENAKLKHTQISENALYQEELKEKDKLSTPIAFICFY